MPYGTVKVDNVTFTNNSVDATTTFSGIYASITNNLTLSGTATAATFTGTTANFTNVNAQNISVTTSLSGLAITGGTAGFTTITGTTVTGTTANFVTVSGTTVTGTTASFTSGIFTSLSGTTHTITSGVFALGTAALPSISFVSDPNTGIYSPGADQVAVATNGTRRLLIDSAGALTLDTGDATIYGVRVGRGASAISTNTVVGNDALTAITTGGLNTAMGGNALKANTDGTQNTAVGYNALIANTSGSYNTAYGLNALYGNTTGSNNTCIGNPAGISLTTGSNNTIIGCVVGTAGLANTVIIGAGATERLRIDSSGNVGIGTSSPDSTLHVLAGVVAGLRVGFNGTSVNYYDADTQLFRNIAGAERARIDSSGNVGIGTSAPASALDVSGGSIKLRNASSGTNYGYEVDVLHTSSVSQKMLTARYMIPGASGSYTDIAGINAEIENASSNLYGMSFRTGGSLTERVRITGAGLVGIGTTSPSSVLNIVGTTTFNNTEISGGYNTLEIIPATAIGSSVNRIVTINTTGLSFETAGSERARIDTSGRLLVGTSTARSNFFNTASSATPQLQVEGTTGNTCSLSSICSIADTSGGRLLLAHQRSGAVGGNTILNSGDEIGVITFQGNDGGQFVESASISAQVDGTPGADDMPGRIVFSTTADGAASPTERMRITSDGDFYFNTTVATKTTAGFRIENSGIPTVSRGDGGTFMQFFHTGSGSLIGTITNVSGTATAYNTTSDYRLKENIAPLVGAINRINNLQVRRFNFIANPDHIVDGFIAHEAQAVVPECVTGEKDAVDGDGNPVYQGIDQSKLVPLLTAALQEAVAKIETLEQRLTAAGID